MIERLFSHPFNQALAEGSLSEETFSFYIEQDSQYLEDFARSHALIAARIDSKHIHAFLKYAESSILTEQETVHAYFRKKFPMETSDRITPALLSYSSYLLRVCSLEPVEVAVAAMLPCFWVYREVGCHLSRQESVNNPYSRWIATYAGEEFSAAVDHMIALFDSLAKNVSEATRQAMLKAFHTSTCLEWHFWENAYHQRVFDDTTSLTSAVSA